jgi:hypothetical protein
MRHARCNRFRTPRLAAVIRPPSDEHDEHYVGPFPRSLFAQDQRSAVDRDHSVRCEILACASSERGDDEKHEDDHRDDAGNDQTQGI